MNSICPMNFFRTTDTTDTTDTTIWKPGFKLTSDSSNKPDKLPIKLVMSSIYSEMQGLCERSAMADEIVKNQELYIRWNSLLHGVTFAIHIPTQENVSSRSGSINSNTFKFVHFQDQSTRQFYISSQNLILIDSTMSNIHSSTKFIIQHFYAELRRNTSHISVVPTRWTLNCSENRFSTAVDILDGCECLLSVGCQQSRFKKLPRPG